MEIRPTGHADNRVFQLWSSQRNWPVCYDSDRQCLVRRRPGKTATPMTFVMEEFDKSIIAGHAVDDLPFLSCHEEVRDTRVDARSALARMLGCAQRRQLADCGLESLSLEHRLSTPIKTLEKIASLDKMALPNPRPCIVDFEKNEAVWSHRSSSSETSTADPGAEHAFQLVEDFQVDQETGERTDSREMVRGSRRIQTIRFRANQDLFDLSCTATCKIGFIKGNITEKLGTFLKREEPYEFCFTEGTVPRRVPAIEFDCNIVLVASNVAGPVFEERWRLKIV